MFYNISKLSGEGWEKTIEAVTSACIKFELLSSVARNNVSILQGYISRTLSVKRVDKELLWLAYEYLLHIYSSK